MMDVESNLMSVVQDIADAEKFIDYDVNLEKGSEKGDGFLGDILLVNVSERKSDKRLNLIAKLSVGNARMRENFRITGIYENEINFYKQVYPKLEAFQKKMDVQHLVTSIAKLYGSSTKIGMELLVMENLKTLRFELFDKRMPVDDEHIRLIFTEYGKFHALSFAYRDNDPVEYSETVSHIQDVLLDTFFQSKEFGSVLTGIFQYVKGLLNSDTDSIDIAVVEEYEKNVVSKINDILSEEEEYSCVLHGDSWSNNMLFRYEYKENEKKLMDMRFLDWQLCRIGSPVLDLSYALYSGAASEVFNNLEFYMQIYHDSLTSMLSELKSDVNRVYPYHIFKEHWQKYAKFGLVMALMVLKIKNTDKADIKDHSDYSSESVDLEEGTMDFINTACDTEAFIMRVKGILRHLKSLNAL